MRKEEGVRERETRKGERGDRFDLILLFIQATIPLQGMPVCTSNTYSESITLIYMEKQLFNK